LGEKTEPGMLEEIAPQVVKQAFLDFAGIRIPRIGSADQGADTGPRNAMDGNPMRFEDFQYADVNAAANPAAPQSQTDFAPAPQPSHDARSFFITAQSKEPVYWMPVHNVFLPRVLVKERRLSPLWIPFLYHFNPAPKYSLFSLKIHPLPDLFSTIFPLQKGYFLIFDLSKNDSTARRTRR
jgi:hypothetical protein